MAKGKPSKGTPADKRLKENKHPTPTIRKLASVKASKGGKK